ncbi:MAG: hypothetical protein NZ693_07765 [Thermoflexales bacterium]|nr:hypothetical protein [Thermoflexales bacterium]
MPQTRPLTPEQANWLRVNTYLPPLIYVGSLAIVAVMFGCMLLVSQAHPFVIILTAAAALLMLVIGVFTALSTCTTTAWICAAA